MAAGDNTGGLVWVGLTPAQAELVVENCNSNITAGLLMLEQIKSRDNLEKMVDLIEGFKGLKAAVEKAKS